MWPVLKMARQLQSEHVFFSVGHIDMSHTEAVKAKMQPAGRTQPSAVIRVGTRLFVP